MTTPPKRRADFGAPIDGYLAKQPPPMRAMLEALRELVASVAPDAQPALKWGMPVFTIDGAMMCALRANSAHVNLILTGPAEAFADPDSLLEGDGKTGRHLKVRDLTDIPQDMVHGWLQTSANLARRKPQ